MPKYRKKPIVFEAFQMTLARREYQSGWPGWLVTAWGCCALSRGGSNRVYMLITPKGNWTLSVDDYILRGENGDLSVVKADAFESEYEAVGEGMRDAQRELTPAGWNTRALELFAKDPITGPRYAQEPELTARELERLEHICSGSTMEFEEWATKPAPEPLDPDDPIPYKVVVAGEVTKPASCTTDHAFDSPCAACFGSEELTP